MAARAFDPSDRSSSPMNTNAPAITHTPGRASNVGLWVLQAVLAFQFAGGAAS